MIQQYLSRLAQRQIVLASGSPRRKKILSNVGLIVKAVPSSFEENLELSDFSSVHEFAVETARCKALEVWNRLKISKVKPDLIISADTVVYFAGEVFPKPRFKEKAVGILEKLSGQTHKVVTGVALVIVDYSKEEIEFEVKTFYEETEVEFCELSPEMIRTYVETNEPLDKAGGYAIQGVGGTFVQSIHGDYFNVVGFPLHKFCCEIYKLCSENLL
ncbi:probable bifunctional dTTP/UTP pyrophosphatase/methyltransferase protein isoform X1 [Parasteatoda tepidariorum]|uniref:probable bifunctional dTTP/UTP pyrophosphatase/methyltransferase protein isoform X1 n=1 Tax=Parasteatoda tepidariorum TaxID=114398 RepID=UPI00077FC01F|nr:probable bifunctional dTTP/UTP pyrophosphatase/methyltransferase protein isoform X1 [Parasteatoda tepidariorum]XP_015927618.1 probable bifunctional dTTP/UTP pyrophosphatase/methyltransferase protein isoform X1 [Parasteatoda tepidariorum]XP_015927620.1 probable bifunctional dTTP/UTP pyrophosphatase/methyltransferase protein isoform X1 [Parasteatoda tepidariorum]XP_042902163.1 probable bifunctional dTTP/UTP pyrophosphatase/methyltransferase protein isoform X1 [Parasteatoda tepidariorum]